MLASTSLVSSNFRSFHLKNPNSRILSQKPYLRTNSLNLKNSCKIPLLFHKPTKLIPEFSPFRKRGNLHICQNSVNTQNPQDPVSKSEDELGNNNGSGGDWTTSFLLFLLWAGLMYYVFNLAPNQTPSRDMYFLNKLLNLKGDDGFQMNEVLVSLWYIMGLWPLVYSMLLLPFGRSSKGKIPVWPFLILSCFGGLYALFPYFILWRPPPPPIEEAELSRWPLNFLESKLTAGLTIAAGLGITTYAGLANGDVWKEFYQYFQESKFVSSDSIWRIVSSVITQTIRYISGYSIWSYFFSGVVTCLIEVNSCSLWQMSGSLLKWADIFKNNQLLKKYNRLKIHATCIDFSLLSAFAPFWVYNDMTARKWDGKGSWLLPVSAVPFLGPALYILLRPSLSALPVSLSSSTSEEK